MSAKLKKKCNVNYCIMLKNQRLDPHETPLYEPVLAIQLLLCLALCWLMLSIGSK